LPKLFDPQQYATPSVVKPQVWEVPALIWRNESTAAEAEASAGVDSGAVLGSVSSRQAQITAARATTGTSVETMCFIVSSCLCLQSDQYQQTLSRA
jgi:hypothetical protein